MEPRSEAGRRLADGPPDDDDMIAAISAIEDEAHNLALDAVAKMIGEVPTFGDDHILTYRNELVLRLLGLRYIIEEARRG